MVNPIIDVHIYDYYFVTEGDTYDKHFFFIEVKVGQQTYHVDRSYLDFVEFDRKLRRQYPESTIPRLPLESTTKLQQIISKESNILIDSRRKSIGSASTNDLRKSFAQYTDPAVNGTDGKKANNLKSLFSIPVTSTEVMKSYEEPLSHYLSDISCHHELLTSAPFLLFLDEEITSMFNDLHPSNLSPYDLLLLNTPINNSIVHRTEQHHFSVPAGHYILWKFATFQYDIGFSLDMDGIARIPLTRYNAHEKPVCGALEAKYPTNVILTWNNTYAKLHTKTLSWAVRIVSKEQFQEGRQQSLACYKEKKRLESQRKALKLAAIRQGMLISKVYHGDIIEEEYEEEILTLHSVLDKKVEDCEGTNHLLVRDLEKAEIQIDELTNRNSNILLEKKKLVESVNQNLQELDRVHREMERARLTIRDQEEVLLQRDQQIDIIENENSFQKEQIQELKAQLLEQQQQVQQTTRKLTATMSDLTAVTTAKRPSPSPRHHLYATTTTTAASAAQVPADTNTNTGLISPSIIQELDKLAEEMKEALFTFKTAYVNGITDLQNKEKVFRDVLGNANKNDSQKGQELKVLMSDVLQHLHAKNDLWYTFILKLNDLCEQLETI